MRRARVPCSRINTVAECMEHPHFRSRDNFVTYTDQTLDREVCAFGVFPKLSATPGRIWRGAPTLGQDTDEILRRILGRSEADIAACTPRALSEAQKKRAGIRLDAGPLDIFHLLFRSSMALENAVDLGSSLRSGRPITYMTSASSAAIWRELSGSAAQKAPVL